MTVDKALLARNFSRAASHYESEAKLQRTVLNELVDNLRYLNIQPKRILDLGAASGLGGRKLAKLFPGAEIVLLDLSYDMLQQAKKNLPFWAKKPAFVCADMDQLPFAKKSFDLVFSSLSIHWSDDQQRLFKNVRECLCDDGLLVFSSLGPETMTEFRHSWQQVDAQQHVNRFTDIQWYGDSLIQAGFADPVLTRELLQQHYATVSEAVGALRALGVVNVNAGRSKQLTAKGRFQSFVSHYETFRSDGLLPVSYEVYYVLAWAASGVLSGAARGGTVAHVPLNSLGVER